MAASSSLSSSSSGVSETSTLEFEHVPYEQYVALVRSLAHQIWPAIPNEQVIVERLRGGSFNRVIGLSFYSPEESQLKQYVLRIPRYDEPQVHRNVASVRFVQQHTNIPVPAIQAFDVTNENPLGDCYMIQDRVSGRSLQTLYPLMSHDARRVVAKQMGDVVHALLSLKGPAIGSIALSDSETDVQSEFSIASIQDTDINQVVPYSEPSCAQDISSALTRMFDYRKEMALNEPVPDDVGAEVMENFVTMTKELASTDYLSDIPITLCHMDLEPRNIIACSDCDSISGISGIIDWDSSIFAPAFMACKPPSWIWSWQDHDDYDEVLVNNTELTEDSLQLKNIFEDAAGPLYHRFAYEPQYRLARRLMHFALRHIGTNEQIRDAYKMLKEWVAMQDGASAVKFDDYSELEAYEEEHAEFSEESGDDSWEETDEDNEDECVVELA